MEIALSVGDGMCVEAAQARRQPGWPQLATCRDGDHFLMRKCAWRLAQRAMASAWCMK